MPVRPFSPWALVLVGLCMLQGACTQNTPPAESSKTAAPSNPKPLKYEVKTPLTAPKETPHEVAEAVETMPESESGSAPEIKAEIPLDDPDAAELTLPKVVMSKGHTDTCLVGVGGTFPDLQLDDLEGGAQSLSKLMGSQLTVVCFWNSHQPSALQELSDLGPDVAERFSSNGVAVVGVNVGDDPKLADELLKKSNSQFTVLSDPQGAALAQLASSKLPRTYLVDSAGKIAWLDIEYSRTTRRELTQAIRFLLSNGRGSAPATP